MPGSVTDAIESAARGLPPMFGEPVHLYTAPRLTWRNGRLESGSRRGTELLASTHVRRRVIVLDSTLPPREMARVFVHELFHLVWVRLGNPARAAWISGLRREFDDGVPGELGWSAELRKLALEHFQERCRVPTAPCSRAGLRNIAGFGAASVSETVHIGSENALSKPDARQTAAWRAYACESFCDSAAYAWARVPGHGEYTLPAAGRRRRVALLRVLSANGLRV